MFDDPSQTSVVACASALHRDDSRCSCAPKAHPWTRWSKEGKLTALVKHQEGSNPHHFPAQPPRRWLRSGMTARQSCKHSCENVLLRGCSVLSDVVQFCSNQWPVRSCSAPRSRYALSVKKPVHDAGRSFALRLSWKKAESRVTLRKLRMPYSCASDTPRYVPTGTKCPSCKPSWFSNKTK
jgi:hypothetical protein